MAELTSPLALARRAAGFGIPVGSTAFRTFFNTGGRNVNPLEGVPQSGFGITNFTNRNPIDPFAPDQFGRPSPASRVLNSVQAENERIQRASNDPDRFDLLKVSKNPAVDAELGATLEDLKSDRSRGRTMFDQFLGDFDRVLKSGRANVEKGSALVPDLRKQLDELNEERRAATNAIADRALQFLNKRLDTQQLVSDVPTGDSTDMRNRAVQAAIDVALPLERELADIKSNQAFQLAGLDSDQLNRLIGQDLSLAQAGTVPLTLGNQMNAAALNNLGQLLTAQELNNFFGIQDEFNPVTPALPFFSAGPLQNAGGQVAAPDISGQLAQFNQSLSRALEGLSGRVARQNSVPIPVTPTNRVPVAPDNRAVSQMIASTPPPILMPDINPVGDFLYPGSGQPQIQQPQRQTRPAGTEVGRVGNTRIISDGRGGFYSESN